MSASDQPNVAPVQPCGHSVYSLAKISGEGIVCMECTGWQEIPDPIDSPISAFRRKDDR